MAEPITQNLGHVTAYGYAKAAGYTGTAEEFAEDQANFAINASKVAEDREAAESSATSASASELAAKTSETNAAASAEASTTNNIESFAARNDAIAAKIVAENAASNAASQTVDDVTEAIRNILVDHIDATVVDGVLVFGDDSVVTVSDGVLTVS